MKSVKKLFYTTIALTLTSFLMKTVAVWFNVYLTDLIGTVGIGIFQLIMSVYAMSKTLAYGGMNLAATRLCIDDFAHFRHSMRRVLAVALALGCLTGYALFIFSEKISILWILTDHAALSLKVLAFSLPFVALSAALNGYMTAARKMGRYSVIQLLEQIAKITLTVAIVSCFGFSDTQRAIAMVCLAITLSEVFSFSLALISYLIDVRILRAKSDGKHGFLKRFCRLALPDAFGSYIRSALNTIEHLLIPRGIKQSGASTERALSDYGIVQGMSLPVVLYPSSILGVVSGLLVPEIAECKIKKNEVQVNYIINRVLHVAMIFSMITTTVLLLYAEPLSICIYKNVEAANFIRMLAPLIPIMYLDMTTDGMLKGLDKQLDIMKINVLDSVLCVVLVYFLVPKVAVDGYIITIYAAEIINFILSFRKLGKSCKMRFGVIKHFFKPAFSAFAATTFSKLFLETTSMPTLNLILSITVGIVCYYFVLRLCGGITKDDSKWFWGLILPN